MLGSPLLEREEGKRGGGVLFFLLGLLAGAGAVFAVWRAIAGAALLGGPAAQDFVVDLAGAGGNGSHAAPAPAQREPTRRLQGGR